MTNINKIKNTSHYSPAKDEQGVAFIEFVISLPFLATLVVGLIDCAGIVNTYFELNRIADNAVQVASSEKQLEEGIFTMGYSSSSCNSKSSFGTRVTKKAAPTGGKQYKIQSKLIKLAKDAIDSKTVNLDEKSFCLVSTYSSKNDDFGIGSEVVQMEVSASYEGITPLFKGLKISSKGHAPYLAYTNFR